MNKNILYQSSVIRKAQVSLANRFIVLKFTYVILWNSTNSQS